jgi:hypothetical protein
MKRFTFANSARHGGARRLDAQRQQENRYATCGAAFPDMQQCFPQRTNTVPKRNMNTADRAVVRERLRPQETSLLLCRNVDIVTRADVLLSFLFNNNRHILGVATR